MSDIWKSDAPVVIDEIAGHKINKIFRNGQAASDYAQGYISSAAKRFDGSEHPVERARRANRERMQAGSDRRFDLADSDEKTVEVDDEDAALRQRVIKFLRTDPDDLAQVSDDELRSMLRELVDGRTDARSTDYARDESLRARAVRVAQAEMNRRARQRTQGTTMRTDAGEHPVARARAAHLERMRAIVK